MKNVVLFVLLVVLLGGCIQLNQDECMVASDCVSKLHASCAGAWQCVQGKCEFKCISETLTTQTTLTKPTTQTTLAPTENLGKNVLAGYYSPIHVSVKAQVPGYALPLKAGDIVNYNKVKSKADFSSGESNLLGNGFTVITNPFNSREEDITQMYKRLKQDEIPVFITTDSLLHLYHIQFDETLRMIEERQFYDYAWNISQKLLEDNMRGYANSEGDKQEAFYIEKEAYRRNAAFFAVALELLKPKDGQYCTSSKYGGCMSDESKFGRDEYEKYTFTVPDIVKSDVEAELALIEGHSGFDNSPVFKYKEDYSQYLPRGHYTRSEKLKNYFKALMWYGRMSFLLKGQLVSAEDARIQTMGASLITSQLSADIKSKTMWDRMYGVTAFYVGFSDDLGPYEYNGALNKVFGGGFQPAQMNAEKYGELKAELATYHSPRIYGGTGNCVILPPFNPEQADQCLGDTKGFRMMGQRFIPDSYMFSNLVSPYASLYSGSKEPKPFTFIVDGAGRPVRGFPRGLDVMAVMGSKRAEEILAETDDSNYMNYSSQYSKLRGEFDSFTVRDWNQNLYWSWLYSLKPLLNEYGEGYPTFMQSKGWQDKELNTGLASWTELRHDTILYAKQSYTMVTSAMPIPLPPEKPVVGYVEPVPEFYARLLALTRMTDKGLGEMNVLDSTSKYRLDSLERILERLQNISERELENEELSQEDYAFIKNFGEELNGVIADVDDKAKKTTIVADVHTDANTGQVLEEGVGYVDMMVVAYKVPDGRVILGAGPVFTYYEFKQPMSSRLTDEKWRNMLVSNPPQKPEWM